MGVLLFIFCRRRKGATLLGAVGSHPRDRRPRSNMDKLSAYPSDEHVSTHPSNSTSTGEMPLAIPKRTHLRGSTTKLNWTFSRPKSRLALEHQFWDPDASLSAKRGPPVGPDLPQQSRLETWSTTPHSPSSPVSHWSWTDSQNPNISRLDPFPRWSFRSSTSSLRGLRSIASWMRLQPLRIDEERPRPTAPPLMARTTQLKNQASAPVLRAPLTMAHPPAKPTPAMMSQTRIGTLSSIFRPASRPSSPALGWSV